MILTRKLILPALIVFAVLLAGIFANTYNSLHNTYHEAQQDDLISYSIAFLTEIDNQKNVTLALGSSVADDPAIQEAFAVRDQQKLLDLTLPGYELLKAYHITQYQFHLPDGALFLSLNDLNNQADNGILSVVELANTEQKPVAGIAAENGRLGVRGVVPIFYKEKYIGSVEFGIGFSDSLLSSLKEKYGGEWRILLSQKLLAGPLPQDIVLSESPVPGYIIYATTQDKFVSNDAVSYLKVLNGVSGETAMTHPGVEGGDYMILTSPLVDFSGKTIGALDIVYDHNTHVPPTQNNRLLLAGLISALAFVLSSLTLVIFTRHTLKPIQTLTRAAADITEGNIRSYVSAIPGNDEIGTLTTAFNRMTSQLSNSIIDLEKRVAERTQDLESQTQWLRMSSEIVRDAVAARNLDKLLIRSTSLILERFKFYHAAIFLLENNNDYAVLAASPTEAGQQMIANNYKVRVGELGIVGRVAFTEEAKVIHDTRSDAAYIDNPLLPNTLSEMALPLKVENRMIGVLDVQSDQLQAFDEEDVAIMQILADQLATAIERTRLLQQVEQNLEDLEHAYGQFTREGWKTLGESGLLDKVGYRFDNIRIQPITEAPELGDEAMQTGHRVTNNNTGDHSNKNLVSLPIKLRGQVIGVVSAKLKDGYTQNTISTLELAIERLALSLESARLYEEARLRADREQAISQVTFNISAATGFDAILRTTVEEIGRSLSDTEVSIQIINTTE